MFEIIFIDGTMSQQLVWLKRHATQTRTCTIWAEIGTAKSGNLTPQSVLLITIICTCTQKVFILKVCSRIDWPNNT